MAKELPPEEKKKLKEKELKEALARAAGELGKGLSGMGGALGGASGQLLQAPGASPKGNLSLGDPLMRTPGKGGISGRGARNFKKGGAVKSRDGVAIKGKTKGRFV